MKSLILSIFLLSIPAFARVHSNDTSLLTPVELDGGAIGAPVGVVTGARRTVNHAMYAALVTQEQINRVQLYLKGGPARNGDLRVVQTGKPDPSQK